MALPEDLCSSLSLTSVDCESLRDHQTNAAAASSHQCHFLLNVEDSRQLEAVIVVL